MKLLESEEELKDWDQYKEFLKKQLKQLKAAGDFFVSKQKIEFSIDGRPWKGHAALVGPKALLCVRKLKAAGVVFRQGTCSRRVREISVAGDLAPNLVKEATKTFKKLRLGFKVKRAEGRSEEDAEDSGDES